MSSSFMNEYYPGFSLKQPLFYRANFGIRFELGHLIEADDLLDVRYLERSYERARRLFESLHAPLDDLLIVMDVWHDGKEKSLKPMLGNYRRYVKKEWLFQLTVQTITISEDGEDSFIERFCLKCRTKDIRYKALLKDICRQDLGMTPNISHPVYVINTRTKTIFNVYDDRGCDVIATSVETLRPLYERYNDWILLYDREKIDALFQRSSCRNNR